MIDLSTSITHAAELYNKGVNTDDWDKGYYLMKEAAAVAISALKLARNVPDVTDKYTLIKTMVEKGYTAEQIQDILVAGL